MTSKVAVLVLSGLVASAGCVPLASPVLNSANSYQNVLADNSNSTLLENVIRVSFYAPLNISDLSSITGALTFSASLTGGVPFGPNNSTISRTLTGMLSGGSTPTFTMAPLNTEGFTLNLIQPISPQYLVSKWRSGSDQRNLLKMFIKWVKEYQDKNDGCINSPDSD